MNFYEQSSGRGIEVCVGLTLLFIALVFAALIGVVFANSAFGSIAVLGSLALALCSWWFGKLGYRLVFNKPRKGGGLLSNHGLKMCCVFFGICSILLVFVSILQREVSSLFSAISMLIACLYGWQFAKKRQDKDL
ncbi:hypothetical protein [Pseudoalteromonas rubra]|uniref:hypothetical protein n=1 Tax=Pseudoalteromonas rubra TaxID=43658 RepID=UPI000F7AA938|nr:hypothetical protein [Pseudoalteromonas rubra]